MTIAATIFILGVIAFLIFHVSRQPDEFRYGRDIFINAPPEKIFAEINNFHRWNAWSPWAKVDPAVKTRFEGPDTGEGAKFHWDGNKNVGTGNLTIVESTPNERIQVRLEFLKPFKGVSMAEFTMTPQDGGTKLSWSTYGPNTTLGKIISLFIKCEKMTTQNMEKGLGNIKSLTETNQARPSL